MSEKILTNKNYGLPVLLALITSFIIAIAGISYAVWGMIEYFYNWSVILFIDNRMLILNEFVWAVLFHLILFDLNSPTNMLLLNFRYQNVIRAALSIRGTETSVNSDYT